MSLWIESVWRLLVLKWKLLTTRLCGSTRILLICTLNMYVTEGYCSKYMFVLLTLIFFKIFKREHLVYIGRFYNNLTKTNIFSHKKLESYLISEHVVWFEIRHHRHVHLYMYLYICCSAYFDMMFFRNQKTNRPICM